MIKIKNILFPTDFSPCADYALKYAISFATEYNAKLYLLHAIHQMNVAVGPGGMAYPVLKAYEDMEKEAKKKLQELLTHHVPESIHGENIIVQGVPFMEIITFAKKHEIDLITIATHGRTGLSHMLMGSTAEKVARKAPCPVLCVKHPDYKFVLP